MNKRSNISALAAAHPHAALRTAEHPGSVPIFESAAETGDALDQPFEEGSRDQIDPDLRHRLISEAAFELYKQRGYESGYELDDWLQAEAQVDHLLLHGSNGEE